MGLCNVLTTKDVSKTGALGMRQASLSTYSNFVHVIKVSLNRPTSARQYGYVDNSILHHTFNMYPLTPWTHFSSPGYELPPCSSDRTDVNSGRRVSPYALPCDTLAFVSSRKRAICASCLSLGHVYIVYPNSTCLPPEVSPDQPAGGIGGGISVVYSCVHNQTTVETIITCWAGGKETQSCLCG